MDEGRVGIVMVDFDSWPPRSVREAAAKPLGPGRTVWLASFPKSGNTWMRAIITALRTHHHLFAVNQLSSGAQPNHVDGVINQLGLDPQWLDRSEIAMARDWLIRSWDASGPPREADDTELSQPIVRKTHECYRPGPEGHEPFPLAATRAAILVVRDPRDVACSYAPFFGTTLDQAVEALGTESPTGGGSPLRAETPQPWGTWSSHAESWLSEDVPFPVFTVRYEDLKVDAAGTLATVFDAIGVDCTPEELQAAVEQARFDRLRASESVRGFRETSRNTGSFFRSGRAGGWQEELTPTQVEGIEADHRAVMGLLGYRTVNDAAKLRGVSDIRESRRRQQRNDWLHLPEHMGIRVSEGELPSELPGAVRPRPWIQVTPTQALVQFSGGAGLLVSDGSEVVVQWQPNTEQSDADPSWLVQGWAVTLAMLQRGDVSLHAATLEVNGKIIALAGHRGAGKSTTSMGLRNRGHRLLIDDVTLVEFRGHEAWTTPYSRNVHLLPDAAAAVGLDFNAMPLLAGGRTKVAFRAEDPPEEPHKIDHIIVLAPGLDEDVRLHARRGASRVTTLTGHLRRDGIAPLVLGHDRYFAALTRLANAAPVWEINRPREGRFTLDEVLDLVESVSLGQGPHS